MRCFCSICLIISSLLSFDYFFSVFNATFLDLFSHSEICCSHKTRLKPNHCSALLVSFNSNYFEEVIGGFSYPVVEDSHAQQNEKMEF